jgi:hypothetical protein
MMLPMLKIAVRNVLVLVALLCPTISHAATQAFLCSLQSIDENGKGVVDEFGNRTYFVFGFKFDQTGDHIDLSSVEFHDPNDFIAGRALTKFSLTKQFGKMVFQNANSDASLSLFFLDDAVPTETIEGMLSGWLRGSKNGSSRDMISLKGLCGPPAKPTDPETAFSAIKKMKPSFELTAK